VPAETTLSDGTRGDLLLASASLPTAGATRDKNQQQQQQKSISEAQNSTQGDSAAQYCPTEDSNQGYKE